MEQRPLIFGVGNILRERVSGFATQDDGATPHVYPDHPDLDLARDKYPRATVDTISHSPTDEDIEKDAFVGETLLDVTVYALSSGKMNQMLDRSVSAILSYHDQDDLNGDPYLENWEMLRPGVTGPIGEEGGNEYLERYNKTQEFEFQHVTVTTV